jgi:hypothetical protein
MQVQNVKFFHPREIESAKLLKSQNVDWVVRIGDWFVADDSYNMVLGTETRDGKMLLVGRNDSVYDKSEVIPMFHRVDCREWLMERGWNVHIEHLRDGQVRVVARLRGTDCRVTRTEPTELAAAYSVMAEVSNLMSYCWA